MKASETKLQSILEGTKQFMVPLFQRTYSWDTKEWETLWGDLEDLREEQKPRDHFIGSTVTIPYDSAPSGVTKFLLIDGQQRLTTVLIILALLRNHAKTFSGSRLAEEINDLYLTNRYKSGNDFWKLLPTQADRGAFEQLMHGEDISQETQIGKAVAFFSKRLKDQTPNDLELLKGLIVSKLVMVDIVLNHDEDPYLIFESLNAKGRPLSQGDLIRNYFFMKIRPEDQQDTYDVHWEPMQEQLGDNLTEFIRHFLMKGGDIVKQGDVYLTLRQRSEAMSQLEIVSYLQQVSRFSTFYAKLLRPENEDHPGLRERMQRLNRIEVTVAYPFLLNVYDDYNGGRIGADEFAVILDILENFMLRRAVCAVPTNQLNKIFPSLHAQTSQATSLIEGVKENLWTKNYPRDAEFRERFVASRMYAAGGRVARTKLILERLETALGNKEVVPFENLSIEHVMPQTLTPWWQQHLGADHERIHELLLHTIGNLTLTAYNAELSNGDFPSKRKRFGESHVGMNEWFGDVESWDEEAIRVRAEALADRALAIWPFFGQSQDTLPKKGTSGVTGKTPTTLVILGQRISVTSWRDVAQQTLQALGDLDTDQFSAIVAKYPRLLAASGAGFRSPRQLTNGYYMETNLSAADLYRFCVQAVESVGLSSEEWHVETK